MTAEEAAQETAAIRRVPRKRHARRKVRPVRVIGILASKLFDGHIVELRIVKLPGEGHRFPRGDVIVKVDQFPGAVVHDHRLFAARLVRRKLHAPIEAEGQGDGRFDAPTVGDIERIAVYDRVLLQRNASRVWREIGCPRQELLGALHNSQNGGVVGPPTR